MDAQVFKYCPYCRTELGPMQRGGTSRLACPAPGCGFVNWDSPVPVVAAIVQHEQHVILVRSHGFPDTWFGLVAGFVESGESMEQAVRREVKEEIGITAEDTSFIGSYPFELRNQLLFVFHMNTAERKIRLEEAELAAYKRVPIDQLIPWSRGTGPAVSEWLAGLGYHPEAVDFGQHIVESD